jgi:hypothetical protein
MFSVVKVRDDHPRGSYKDPGWYRHPQGTVAREFTGAVEQPARAPAGEAQPRPAARNLDVRKPSGGHRGH